MQTYRQDQGLPNTNPFTWAVSGKMYTALAIQAAGAQLLVSVMLAELLRWFRLKIAGTGTALSFCHSQDQPEAAAGLASFADYSESQYAYPTASAAGHKHQTHSAMFDQVSRGASQCTCC